MESAPSYVTVQEWDDCYEVTYLMLYAYQGPQTAHWHLSRQPYDCLIRDFGRHQGDIEWVSLSLDKITLQPREIGLQAHGKVRTVAWSQCPRAHDHPLVRAALHGHACALAGEADRVVQRRLGGVLSICDLYGDGGQVWRPSPRLLGLDDQGEPINDEVWAKFQGRIGRALDNHFRRMTRLDGAAVGLLPRLLGWLVRMAEVRGWLPQSIRHAEGTPALGDPGRWFTHGQKRSGKPLRQCPY